MPRVHTVKKARASKRTRTCRICSHVIAPGETYRYFEPRYGPPVMYCAEHHPRRSHMTSSAIGAVYDAQDDFDISQAETVEEVSDALQTIADTAREVAEQYEESISNMPEALQESSHVAEEMREKIDALKAYADECESWDADMDEFDEENARGVAEHEIALEMIDEMELKEEVDSPIEYVQEHGDESAFVSRVDAAVEDARSEWNPDVSIEDVRESAEEVVNNFEY